MYSKSPSRNNRSKGIKVKHILQICLLVAVCFWLMYQVKRSHEKKKEFDEKDATLGTDILRLGRKDLPRGTEIGTDDKVNGEDDEENEAEQVENRHEEDEQEIEESRAEDREEEEDAAKGSEDDEIDKTEVKNEDEFVNEEKEDNDDGEKEDNEESEAVLERQDHEGNTQQEREEHYKADDASSEVAHDASIISGAENATLLIVDGKENVSQSSSQPLLQKTMAATNSSDSTIPETMELKENLTVPVNSSSENSTALTEPEQSNNITQAQNATTEDNRIAGSQSNLPLNLVSHANMSELVSDEAQSVTNTTEPANITLGSLPEVKKLELAENITDAAKTKVDSVNLAESSTVDNPESKSENNVTGEENGALSDTTNDSVDDFASSMTQEENEARSDPGTLPDIKVGLENAENVEAE